MMKHTEDKQWLQDSQNGQNQLVHFTVGFNSRARSGVRCDLCLTLRHDAGGCTRTEGEMDLALRLRTTEAALGAPHPSSSEGGPLWGYEATDTCKLYNVGRCYYQPCKFRHVCRACRGDHPATASPECNAKVIRWTPRVLGPMHQGHSMIETSYVYYSYSIE